MSKYGDALKKKTRQYAEQRRNMGGMAGILLPEGVEMYKPEKGKPVTLDILLYKVGGFNAAAKPGEFWWELTYDMHRDIGPSKAAMVCPRSVGKRCPVCEEREKLMRDADADEDVVAGLRPKRRQIFNVMVNGGDDIQILDISYHLFGKQLEAEIREGDPENAAFADPVDGKAIKVRWAEKAIGKGQPFLEADRIDFVERDPFDEKIVEESHVLETLLKVHTYEEMSAALHGVDGEGGATEEAEEDQKPRRRGPKPPAAEEEELEEEETPPARPSRRGGKPAPEPEEEEEDEEEEEQPKPSRRGAAVKTKAKAEPEEEEEEEEEEQPKPSRRTSTAAAAKPTTKKTPVDDPDDVWPGEEEEEEEEEETPPARPSRRSR